MVVWKIDFFPSSVKCWKCSYTDGSFKKSYFQPLGLVGEGGSGADADPETLFSLFPFLEY